jgi:hypothetical protein
MADSGVDAIDLLASERNFWVIFPDRFVNQGFVLQLTYGYLGISYWG